MSEHVLEQNNTPRIRIPATLFCALTPLIVAMRFWSRRQTKSAFGSDDWTILGSMILELGDCSVLLAACSFGFGKRSATLNAADKRMALKLFYCSQILYKVSLNLTKASILLLYLRAFTLRKFRIACWALMAVVVAYGISATVSTILQCNPLSRAWDKTTPGTCINIVAFWYANACYTILTDLILLILPIGVIGRLQLRSAQKAAVLMVFAIGGLVTVFSIIRMTTIVASATSTDPTYDIESTSWANIEANIAILCACLPIYRRPLALLFPQLFPSLGDHARATQENSNHIVTYPNLGGNLSLSDFSKTDEASNIPSTLLGDDLYANQHGGRTAGVALEHVEDIKTSLDSRMVGRSHCNARY